MTTIAAVPAAPAGPEHASAEEFAQLVRAVTSDQSYVHLKLKHRREFVERYPDLTQWSAQPLTNRVGRLLGEDPRRAPVTDPISYNARHYLTFLGVTGRMTFDWDWLLAPPALNVWIHAEALGLPLVKTRQALTELGVKVGFRAQTADRAAEWALSRMLLHGGQPTIADFTVTDFQEILAAMDAFGARPDRPLFHGDDARWASKRRNWGSQVFLLQLLLYHAGHIPESPQGTAAQDHPLARDGTCNGRNRAPLPRRPPPPRPARDHGQHRGRTPQVLYLAAAATPRPHLLHPGHPGQTAWSSAPG